MSTRSEGDQITRVILRQYDISAGKHVSLEVDSKDGCRAVKDWIARNSPRFPSPEKVGNVMPAAELVLFEGDETDPGKGRTVEVYHELDRSGAVAVPAPEIKRLVELFQHWGRAFAEPDAG